MAMYDDISITLYKQDLKVKSYFSDTQKFEIKVN